MRQCTPHGLIGRYMAPSGKGKLMNSKAIKIILTVILEILIIFVSYPGLSNARLTREA